LEKSTVSCLLVQPSGGSLNHSGFEMGHTNELVVVPFGTVDDSIASQNHYGVDVLAEKNLNEGGSELFMDRSKANGVERGIKYFLLSNFNATSV